MSSGLDRLAQVPLPRLDPLVLLNLQPDAQGQRRDQPDHDYEGYGVAVVPALVLESDDGTRTELSSALVLALHSADEQPEGPGIELELDMPDPAGGEPLTVLAPLDAFLRAHLPTLPGEPPHVVLALCNPRSASVERPESLDALRRLHYAHGDVLSWLDVHDDGHTQIRLRAHSWHRR